MLGTSVLLVLAAPYRDYSSAGWTWPEFKAAYGRTYTSAADASRERVYEANRALIVEHNSRYQSGKESWWAEVNEFADWTAEEFASMKLGRRNTPFFTFESAMRTPNSTNPDSVDWRLKKVVTPVKNQGGCGSCWAFASTETIESHYAIAGNELLELAPQTLVSCSKNPDHCGGTGGCEGSIAELAFNFTAASGIAKEADLPYKGEDAKCPQYKPAVKVDGYVKLAANSAAALEAALATAGPVAVNVAAMPWQLYGGGIFSGGCKNGAIFKKSCDIDHVVQAVGYAKASADSPGYWLVRNSWGTGWGEDGYIRLTRANDDAVYSDKKPADGTACKPFPHTQKVGGESGVLFDMSYPTGARPA